MTTDDLQQYLFKKVNEMRAKAALKGNEDPEYQRAIKEIAQELLDERDDIVKSYETLKKFKLVL